MHPRDLRRNFSSRWRSAHPQRSYNMKSTNRALMAQPTLTFFVALSMMSLCWVISVYARDVSIVDILWGPAFAVIAWTCLFTARSVDTRAWLSVALVTIWAIRLGSSILLRWRRLGLEDHRYAAIRERRGPNFAVTSLFWIFWLQALLLWIVSWPLQAIFSTTRPVNWLDVVGGAFAFGGIVVEAVADYQ